MTGGFVATGVVGGTVTVGCVVVVDIVGCGGVVVIVTGTEVAVVGVEAVAFGGVDPSEGASEHPKKQNISVDVSSSRNNLFTVIPLYVLKSIPLRSVQ